MDRECRDFDVKDYLERKGIGIKKISGDELIMDCFFCNPPDTKGHLYVNMKTTQFHCFKCNHDGNIFTLMKHFGDPVQGAQVNEKQKQQIEQQQKIEKVLHETAEFYHQSMTDGIRQYLLGRGLAAATMDKFKLGYANGGLRKHLSDHGFALELCQQAGVIQADGKDYFYEKIIIPYFYRNRVVQIRCRTNPDEQKKAYFPIKGYEVRLFNEDALLNAKEVIICEGELDALMLFQMGFSHVAAISGAGSFKEEWIAKFQDCRIVYLVLDADKSGENGALRIAKLLGERARLVQLPAGMDVNDYFLNGHGKEDFEKLLECSLTRIELLIKNIEKMPRNLQKEEIRNLFDEFVELDAYNVEEYKNLICDRFNIGKNTFKNMLKLAKEQHERNKKVKAEREENKIIELSDEEKEEATQLLKNPNLIEIFITDIEKIGCVGEEENKVMTYFTMSSRKTENPISLAVKGESAGGKSHLVEKTSKFIPKEDVLDFTSITAKSLFYRDDDLAHKVLIIYERQGAEDSDYTIRSLQSEKKLKFSAPVKNMETGLFNTVDKELEGPVAYIETTTKSHLHPENETRCFNIYVDESIEQTEKIFDKQNEKYMGIEINTQGIVRKWQNAQRLLKPYPVLIPFIQLIKFPNKPLRVRRDRERFLTIIETNAFLHQYQRKKEIKNGKEYLVATTEDYAIAYRLANKILLNTVKGLSPRLKAIIKTIWAIVEKKANKEKKAIEHTLVLMSEIENNLDWNRKTITKYVKEADREGLIDIINNGDGKAFQIRAIRKINKEDDSLLLSQEELKEKYLEVMNQSTPVQQSNGQANYIKLNELNRANQALQLQI